MLGLQDYSGCVPRSLVYMKYRFPRPQVMSHISPMFRPEREGSGFV